MSVASHPSLARAPTSPGGARSPTAEAEGHHTAPQLTGRGGGTARRWRAGRPSRSSSDRCCHLGHSRHRYPRSSALVYPPTGGSMQGSIDCRFRPEALEDSVAYSKRGSFMVAETGGTERGPSPPGPINSISWVGPGGPNIGITKMGPFYFSWTVFQQLQ